MDLTRDLAAIIPTIVVPYGIDIETAGSLPVSLPTMPVAFARYSCFVVLRNNIRFVVARGLGSIRTE